MADSAPLIGILYSRRVKRFLLFIFEAAVLIASFFFALSLIGVLVAASGLDSPYLALILFPLSFLTLVALVPLRRRTRPWKIEYDAAIWQLSRAERKQHPIRARCKLIARRVLVWVPSVIAALVLFFLPVATHLKHPRSRYLKHYCVPIPWTFTVLSSLGPSAENGAVFVLASTSGIQRFGVTPFGRERYQFSLLTFGSSEGGNDVFNRVPPQATVIEQREFRLDDAAVVCRQYTLPNREGYQAMLFGSGSFREIACGSPTHASNFYATFAGRENDVAAFYKTIAGVTPVK